MLLHAVEHLIFRADGAAKFVFHAFDVAARAQSELKAREAAFFLEEGAREVEGGENIGVVVLALPHGKRQTARVQIANGERFDRIGEVDAFAAARGANLELVKIERSDLLCQTVAEYTVIHAG